MLLLFLLFQIVYSSRERKFDRDQRFDDNWTFFRGSLSPEDAASIDFDDSSWDTVTLPHDFSTEDLPSRENDRVTPVVSIRYGDWMFQKGTGESSWSRKEFNDSSWRHVSGGVDWRIHSNFSDANATGWYRQHFAVEDWQINASDSNVSNLILSLGHISGSDETYVNDLKVGCTGDIESPDPEDYVTWRRYSIPSNLLLSSSSQNPKPNVVAIKIKSFGGPLGMDPQQGSYPGGLYDDEKNLQDVDLREGPFDASASFDWRAVGSTVGGVAWYRKTFTMMNRFVPSKMRVNLRFDGVYMNSEVFLNNEFIGSRPYGYTTFSYDITDKLIANETNVLAVRVNNLGQNSRWYAGSGIYRHVWMTVTGNVHVPLHGVHAYTSSVDITSKSASLHVDVKIHNAGPTKSKNVRARVNLYDSSGKIVPGSPFLSRNISVDSNKMKMVEVQTVLRNTKLWSVVTPNLYVASVEIVDFENNVLDNVNQTFGVRKLNFTSTHGFLLNDVPTKLYGGCVHHANGPLGSRALDRAEERRVELLKEMGYNAVRTSHNPVSIEFLNAADRLGMLIMEEAFDCWEQGKLPDDYHNYFDDWWERDLEAMILRDRSHPSIVMWSIGNEIPMRATEAGYNLSNVLTERVRNLDPNSGRAITSAVPSVEDNDDKFFAPLDVAGYNYSPDRYLSDHDRFQDRIIVGTESFPAASFQMWNLSWSHKYVIGDFIWTAIDYIGETGIGSSSFSGDVDQIVSVPQSYKPFGWHISFCGDLDICGHLKPQGIYRKVLWNQTDIALAIHVPIPENHTESISSWGFRNEVQSWSFPDIDKGTLLNVNVYTRVCSYVRVSLNGNEISKKHVGVDTEYTATFSVEYDPGVIEASCVEHKTTKARLVTAGSPHRVQLNADRHEIRSDVNDLSYVTATVVDSKGQRVPYSENEITFRIEGSCARIAAVGNGNPYDRSSFHSDKRDAWRGRALAIVQPIKNDVVCNVTLHASLSLSDDDGLRSSISDDRSSSVLISIS